MLDVRRLQVLCEVARRGSLSRAAEALNYTTSAISQQITALEREVGMTLVERRPRGVALTEAGSLLVERAQAVLDQLAAAEAALGELAALRRGRLRIASFATAGATIVPRAVDLFQAQYPHVEVRVQQATSGEGVVLVGQRRVDIALAVDQPPTPDVDIVDLYADSFSVALHRKHPLAAATELRLIDLADDRWIDVPNELPGGGVLATAFAALHRTPTVAYESDDYTAIHELVGAGLGVALLPDLALFPPNRDVVLRSLASDVPYRRIQAALRPQPLRSPATTAMLTILQALEPRRRGAGDGDQAVVTSAPSR